jgi:uncharacterized protein
MAAAAPPPAKPRRRRRWVWGAAALLALWLASSAAAVWALTHRLRAAAPEPAPRHFEGFAALEDLRLKTTDGEELGAWFLPGRADRPPVLALHGYGMNRGATLFHANSARLSGCPVLLLSLRSHGDSTGSRIDFGWSSRRDVEAGVAWLEGRCPGRKPVAWGVSMGAAAALFAAEELGGRVQAYLLEAPFQDLDHALQNRLRMYLPNGLRQVAYAGMRLVALGMFPELPSVSATRAAAGLPAGAKLLVVVGAEDRHAPPAESRAVLAAAGHGELLTIPGAHHMNLTQLAASRAEYRAAARKFLDSIP